MIHRACFILAAAVFAPAAQDREVDELVRRLGTEDVGDRDRAVRALVELGERARPAVEKACGSNDPEVAYRARQVVKGFGPRVRMVQLYEAGFDRLIEESIPGFAARLWSEDPKETVRALEAVTGVDLDRNHAEGRYVPTPVPPRLKNVLALARVMARYELSTEVRRGLARTMATLELPAFAPCVTPLLTHADKSIRIEALRALGEARAREAAPQLARLLLDKELTAYSWESFKTMKVAPPADVIREVARAEGDKGWATVTRAIGEFKMASLVPDAVALLKHPDSNARSQVLQALQYGPHAPAHLGGLMDDPDPAVRAAALSVAARWRLPAAAAAAIRSLDAPEATLRKAALEAVVSLDEPSLREKVLACRSAEALLAAGRLGLKEAVPIAREALRGGDGDRRCAAVKTLRRLDAHEAAGDLVSRLEDETPAVRAEAAVVLPHLAGDRAGPALQARLRKESDPVALASVIRALAEIGLESAGPDVLPFLRHADRGVAEAALRAVGPLRVEGAVPVLMELVMATGGDAWATMEALALLKPPDLLERVVPCLKDEDKERRKRAFTLVYAVDRPEADPYIVKALSDPVTAETAFEMVKARAMVSAGPELIRLLDSGGLHGSQYSLGEVFHKLGAREAVDHAVGWLSGFREDARYAGLHVLSAFKAREKLPEILKLLDDKSDRTRGSAWQALLWMADPASIPEARRRVRGGTSSQRGWAAWVLGRVGDRESVPAIEELLDDPSPWTREKAAEALGELRSAGSFDRLAESMESASERRRGAWIGALVATDRERGREIARRLMGHESEDVRRYAAWVLGKGRPIAPGDVVLLTKACEDQDLAHTATYTLAENDPEAFVPLLSHPMRHVRAEAIRRVRDMDVKVPAGRLLPLLRETDPYIRSLAAEVAGLQRVKEAADALAEMVHDVDDGGYSDSMEASVALARIGDRRGLGAVLEAVRRRGRDHRVPQGLFALNALRRPAETARIVEVRVPLDPPRYATLGEGLEELSRRSGLTLSVSPAFPAHILKRPCFLGWSKVDARAVFEDNAWSVSCIVESDSIRVVTVEESICFWRSWIRD